MGSTPYGRGSVASDDSGLFHRPVRECSMALRVIDEDENAMWGRPPGLQADALVGSVGVTAEFEQRDQGVPRRPGGLPHNVGVMFRGADAVPNWLRFLRSCEIFGQAEPPAPPRRCNCLSWFGGAGASACPLRLRPNFSQLLTVAALSMPASLPNRRTWL